LATLQLVQYSSWDDTDGKDESYAVIDEVFTSAYDTWVNLAGTYIGGEVVTTTDGLTTFLNGTDYQMDYINGQIKVLSTGNMVNATNYHIDYNYDETKEYDDTLDASVFWDDWVAVHFDAYYEGVGIFEGQAVDLNKCGAVQSTTISWTENVPAGASVTIEVALSADGGVTWDVWRVAANGGALPGLSAGMDLTGYKLKYRVKLNTTDLTVTPSVTNITVTFVSRKMFRIFADGTIKAAAQMIQSASENL